MADGSNQASSNNYQVLAQRSCVRTPFGAEEPSLPLPDDLGFAPWEHWAWKVLATGGDADMRAFPDGAAAEAAFEAASKTDESDADNAPGEHDAVWDGHTLSPEPPAWPAHRTLSERFLRLVLLTEPWASARARERVEIYHARFEEGLDFGGALARGDLMIAYCRFEQDVTLVRFRLEGSLLLLDCRFAGAVLASALSTAGDIFLDDSTFESSAIFRAARCPGQFGAQNCVFVAGLDANGVEATGGIYLSESRLGGDLDLCGAQSSSSVMIMDAQIDGVLDASGARTTGVVLDGATVTGDAVFRAVEVDGQFSAQNVAFGGALRLAWLKCSGGLFLRAGKGQGAQFVPRADNTATTIAGELGLSGARISGGAFDLRGIDCAGAVDGEGLVVDGAARLDHSTFRASVRLSGARFSRNLTASGAVFQNAFKATNIAVDNNLLLRARRGAATEGLSPDTEDTIARAAPGPIFRDELDLVGAKIGGALDLSGATLDGPVDLTAAAIEGELRFASSKLAAPAWGDGARLILRNLKARAIQATEESLLRDRARPARRAPRSAFVETDLTGASFERLSGADAGRGASLAEAHPRVLAKWIEAHTDYQQRHDPGPYRETADALRKAGRPGAARIVLIESYDHEISCRETRLGRRAVLAVWNVFTRYGFSVTLPLLVWVPLLIAAQMTAGLWAEGWRPGGASLPSPTELGQWFIAAASNTVPIVDLAPSETAGLDYRFPNGAPHWLEQTWFWASVFGFVVLSYLAAAIGGLARTDRD